MPGYKAAKDRLNLLFGDSASNNLKLKRLLVYHSKNLRALKDIAKGSLPAVWKSNPKTWVRRAIFQNQFFHHFNLEIEKFAWRRTFHSAFFCCSTVLWATPIHGQLLFQHQNSDLSANTTLLIQPMDQGVIVTFKKYYLYHSCGQAVKMSDKSQTTLQQFWKDCDIYKARKNFDFA